MTKIDEILSCVRKWFVLCSAGLLDGSCCVTCYKQAIQRWRGRKNCVFRGDGDEKELFYSDAKAIGRFLVCLVFGAECCARSGWHLASMAGRSLPGAFARQQAVARLSGWHHRFSEPERSFFVLGDPHEGIPVHVIGPYPDIKVGDRVHIEGTTMFLLQQPGVRLVAWKKLADSVEDAKDRASVSDFTPTDPFFKKVQVQGLVTSVAQGNVELLIGISRTAAESYLLRIPDRVWESLPREQVLGDWVKVIGFYLPADPRATHQSGRNSFAISSQEDILLHQDLVHGSSLNFESLADRLDSDTPKAVMAEGELNQLDAYQWVLKLNGGEIMLDWAENTDFSGRRSRCIGFPIRRSGQIVLKPSMVFLEKAKTEPDAAESAAKTDWEFRSTEYVEPLTTIAEAVALDEEAARRNKPVDLEVTVTYHHPTSYVFFVQDQTDGVYVTTDNTSVEWLAGGTKIRLMGNTVQGFLKHNIQDAEYEILEQGAFPEPIFCDLESL